MTQAHPTDSLRPGITLAAAVAIALLLAPGCARQARAQDSIVSTTPTERLSEPEWAARHAAMLQAVKDHPDAPLLLLGDSITNNYVKSNPPDENFKPIWNRFYASRNALNLGFSGDATEHLLWRLQHGEVDHLHPKAVVLLIGTNNTGHYEQSAEQTERGIDAVILSLREHMPATDILLLAILPSDLSESKSVRDHAVNRYLATTYSHVPHVTYLDIGSIFYNSDGTLNTSLFYDPRLPWHPKALHPDTEGQRRMAESIEPTLANLLHDTPK